MKLSKIICIALSLILSLCAGSCRKPAEDKKSSDFEASVSTLTEAMDVEREEAIEILEILCSLGLDARIDSIYIGSDDNGIPFYKVWFGLNLLHVYTENAEVVKVLKYGEVIYPTSDTSESIPKDPPSDPLHKIELISMTSRLRAGDEARIEVVGNPDTVYEIKVRYSSGVSSAQGLEPKLSDADGRVSWTWRVSPNVKPGEYSIEISSGNTSYKTTFTVG